METVSKVTRVYREVQSHLLRRQRGLQSLNPILRCIMCCLGPQPHAVNPSGQAKLDLHITAHRMSACLTCRLPTLDTRQSLTWRQ